MLTENDSGRLHDDTSNFENRGKNVEQEKFSKKQACR